MDEKQVLNDALIGEALSGLKTHQGYKVLIDEIIFPIYRDAFAKLEEKDDSEARATINAIKNIIAKIDDKINLGKQAREEYRQELEKHKS